MNGFFNTGSWSWSKCFRSCCFQNILLYMFLKKRQILYFKFQFDHPANTSSSNITLSIRGTEKTYVYSCTARCLGSQNAAVLPCLTQRSITSSCFRISISKGTRPKAFARRPRANIDRSIQIKGAFLESGIFLHSNMIHYENIWSNTINTLL